VKEVVDSIKFGHHDIQTGIIEDVDETAGGIEIAYCEGQHRHRIANGLFESFCPLFVHVAFTPREYDRACNVGISFKSGQDHETSASAQQFAATARRIVGNDNPMDPNARWVR
jgi:hypothetical protein